MNFLQVIHFFPTLSTQAFKPCGKVLKDNYVLHHHSGGSDETTQQIGGCDLIVTARGGHSQKESGGRRRQGTVSSTQKTQATLTGSVTLAQVLPSQH